MSRYTLFSLYFLPYVAYLFPDVLVAFLPFTGSREAEKHLEKQVEQADKKVIPFDMIPDMA